VVAVLMRLFSQDVVFVYLTTDSDTMSQSSVDAAKYVPRERHSVIGQRPSEVSIKTDDITDVRQLETLFRIHVMLAQVAGRSSPHYTDYILLAYGFVYRVLQVGLSLSRLPFYHF